MRFVLARQCGLSGHYPTQDPVMIPCINDCQAGKRVIGFVVVRLTEFMAILQTSLLSRHGWTTGCASFAAAAFCLVSLPLAAGTFSFSIPDNIQINDTGNPPTTASLYPSTINVSGLDGQSVSQVTLTLNGLSHSFPSDLDIGLAGPGGQMAMLMSEVGGNIKYPVSNLTITLDNNAANSLPVDAPLTSGTFKPTRQFPTLPFDFPSPAPSGIANAPADLSVFNGSDPDGAWSLYIVDESSPDSGSISSGWTLDITTAVPEPGSAAIFGLGVAALVARRRNGFLR